MAARLGKMNKSEVLTTVQSHVRHSVGYLDSRLSRERQLTMEYYDGKRPKQLHRGNSRYVSQDVYDAVEMMKAQLLETFTGNAKPIRFPAQNAEDVEPARIAESYIDYVMYRQNDGYSICSSTIHDGLWARIGVVKAYWDETYEDEEEDLPEPVSREQLDVILSQDDDLEEGDLELDDDTGLYTGTLIREVDTSQVRIEVIPPEEFLVSPRAPNLEKARFVSHRFRTTQSEMLAMGYDKKLVKKMSTADDYQYELEPEIFARFDETGDTLQDEADYQNEELRPVIAYESYPMLDVNRDGNPAFWRIVHSTNVILEMEEVKRRPFFIYVPVERPHSLWGNNYAERVQPTQNARSMLVRSIIDHALITTNPRFQVLRNSLDNPKELMENRLGGIVNINRPDAVTPLQVASLNPFIFQTVQLLDDDKEETTGISRLSQGLNKDAISQQNSAEMVNQMVTVSQQRQKIAARNFGEKFLKPLVLYIYELVIENEAQEKIIEVAGNWVPISPSKWKARTDVTVAFHVGHNEAQKAAQQDIQLYGSLASDPMMKRSFGPEKRYNLARSILEQFGHKDIDNFLDDPAKMKPEEPSPVEQLQMQAMQLDMKIKEAEMQIKQQQMQIDMQAAMQKAKADEEDRQRKYAIDSDKVDVSEAALAHKKVVDLAELELLRTKQVDETRGIVSPSG